MFALYIKKDEDPQKKKKKKKNNAVNKLKVFGLLPLKKTNY